MKKQLLLILTILLISFNYTMAQQLPNVSYFMYDYSRTNPGSLGSKDMVCASGIWKNQLQGFEGAPTDFIMNAEVPFNLFGAKHGVGISINNDVIGFYSDIDFKLGYAFRFNVAEGTLGIGINGDIRQKTLKTDEWNVGANGDPLDPNLPTGNQENLKGFGLGAGIFYRSEDIYFGASVANIYSSEIKYESGSASETIRPHYYLSAGYNFQLSNPAYEIEPAVQFYSDGVSTTFDLNGTLTYNKRIWGGVSYRAGSAVVGMLGIMIMDGLKVGYAYDYSTSALSKHSSGGHEVLLNYCFKIGVEKSPQRYRSVRYL
jgi:type IX secretion system PorP/SprF family membrane protein